MMVRKVERCRICGGKVSKIMDLGNQKLTGVFPAQGEDVEDGELTLVKCVESEGCGLVQLGYSFDPEKMYGNNYGYRSGLNKSMVEHLDGLVAEVVRYRGGVSEGDFVLDIGSNDGTLLSLYDKHVNVKLDKVGIDPSGGKFHKYYADDVVLIPEFFTAERIRKEKGLKKAKIVTSIAMFYDLEDPVRFASDIASILHEEGIWIAEQSYFPLMVKANAYDTVCHEHIEYYALKQILWIADKAGLKVVHVSMDDTNGGSFRTTFAKKASPLPVDEGVTLMQHEEDVGGVNSFAYVDALRAGTERSRQALLKFLNKQKSEGRLVLGYGASTKGNVVLQYCGIDRELLPAIAEVNEDKFGKRTPGTDIPIISETEAKAMKPDYFLVLPWHFKSNILKRESSYMRSSGCKFVFHLPEFEVIEL